MYSADMINKELKERQSRLELDIWIAAIKNDILAKMIQGVDPALIHLCAEKVNHIGYRDGPHKAVSLRFKRSGKPHITFINTQTAVDWVTCNLDYIHNLFE